MGMIIDFSWKVKEFSCLVRNLNNSNDELSRSLAIAKAQAILNEYKHDICHLDEYSTSEFYHGLIVLLSKLE